METRRAACWFVAMGWLSLALSSTCFFIGIHYIAMDSNWTYAVCMMIARLFGFCSFVLGAVAIFNRYWLNGALLFIGSIGLPIVSLFIYGKL
jgi:hypothetical protein